jgi:hypothetical protein
MAIRWPESDCLARGPAPFDEPIKPELPDESSQTKSGWDFGSNNNWFSKANASIMDESLTSDFDIYH